jgi:hypothetical protein
MYIELISHLALYFVYLFLGWSAVSRAPHYITRELEIHNPPDIVTTTKRKKVKQSRYRPGVTQRVPGS